jgi:hypothetical protein
MQTTMEMHANIKAVTNPNPVFTRLYPSCYKSSDSMHYVGCTSLVSELVAEHVSRLKVD